MEKNQGELARRIEQVILEFLIENKAAAAGAIENGFGCSAGASTIPRARAAKTKNGPPTKRRSLAEIDAVRERFLRAVVHQPGETMQALASMLGESPTQLYRYSIALKERDLIRTVGKLQSMRYFPAAKAAMATQPT